jgi:hypothetical protein
MFFFGLIEDGPRGLEMAADGEIDDEDDDIADDDIAGYGIDWEDLADAHIRAHHDAANHAVEEVDGVADDRVDEAVAVHAPANLAEVVVDEPDCPLTREQVAYLDAQLEMQSLWDSRTLQGYRLRWSAGFDVCRSMGVL